MSNGNVFISGASRGIGNSIAYHFAENDYVVVGTSRNEFEFDKKIKNLIPLKLDVTSREDIQNCFNDLKTKNLLPDILINNAGITSDQIFLFVFLNLHLKKMSYLYLYILEQRSLQLCF